jgi:hypothetical protein
MPIVTTAEMRRELGEIRSGITEPQLPTEPLPSAPPPPPPSGGGLGGRARDRHRDRRALASLAESPTRSGPPGTHIELAAGEGFEFKWPAEDSWKLQRGEEQVSIHSGTDGAAVPPGTYRIVALSDPVFEPVEFVVRAGRKTLVSVPAGRVELTWAGKDYWKILRGETMVGLHQGTARRVVAPGQYRIVPNSEAVFEPVELKVEPGKTTVVNVPSGTFELQWAGRDYWKLILSGTPVTVLQGTPAAP